MSESLATTHRPRITVDLKVVDLPEIPRLGIHKVTDASDPLPVHRHRGVIEICYLVSGEQWYRMAGRDHRLIGNEVFWTAPNEAHCSGTAYHGKGLLYWMQIRLPTRSQRWLCLSPQEARPLIAAVGTLPKRHFIGDKRLKTIFEDVYQLAVTRRNTLCKVRLAARVIDWLGVVIDSARSNSAGGPTDDIRRVLEVIESGRADAMRVRDLADLAAISEPHFKAKFRRQVGMPPGEYLNRNRIERAAALLAESDLSVTQVAHRLGFNSSQYFATTFKRFTHASPGEVIRRRTSSASR